MFLQLSLFRFLISQISDIRERHYEKTGIGSSYLFRLDDGYVVSETTLEATLHALLFYFIFSVFVGVGREGTFFFPLRYLLHWLTGMYMFI